MTDDDEVPFGPDGEPLDPRLNPDRPQSHNLMPFKPGYDERRENARLANLERGKRAKIRRQYDVQLRELQQRSYTEAVDRIEAGEAPTAMEVAQNIVNQLSIQLGTLNPQTTEYNKCLELLIKANAQYAAMTGENAPSKQSIDIVSTTEEAKSVDEIEGELLDITNKLLGNND